MAEFPGKVAGQAPMVLLSRKGQTRYRDQFTPPHLHVKTSNQLVTGPSSSNSDVHSNESVKSLSASVVFVKDDMEIVDFILNHLCKENQAYTVIGAIGLQGTGKSTLLSMLAGNQTLDKFRQYVFRPCSKDTIYTGLYQTNGLHVYVTDSRVIYIDCKPFNCSAVFEEQIRKTKTDANLLVYKNTQIEGLTLLALMFELCDTLLFTVDWFIDVNAVQEVLRAALYSEFNFRKFSGYPKSTNLVVVHQRAKSTDFEMFMVKKRARMIKSMFKDSGYNVNGGISMANLGFTEYSDCEPDVNYIVIDDLPQWQKDSTSDGKLLNIAYDAVLKRLRPALLTLKKHGFRDLSKMRPARRRNRTPKLNLPPTLDPKRAAQLKSEQLASESTKRLEDQDRNNGNTNGDDDRARDFVPEHMPNISRFKELPTEPWNEQQLNLSALSLPESMEDAFKSLSLLLATHSRRNDYVDILLPSVSQSTRHTEKEWFEYAQKVLDITKKAYASKYFISNNGRIVPRLIRKFRDATKVIYTDVKSGSASKRISRRKTLPNKSLERSTKKQERLSTKLKNTSIAESADEISLSKEVDKEFEIDEVSATKEDDQHESSVTEDDSTDFDDDSSEGESAQSSSESSSSNDPKEKNARRTTRRRQQISSEEEYD